MPPPSSDTRMFKSESARLSSVSSRARSGNKNHSFISTIRSVEPGGIARDAKARRLRTHAPNPRNFFEKNYPVFLFHTKESKRRKHVRRRSHERRQDDPIGGVHQGDEAIGRGCRG